MYIKGYLLDSKEKKMAESGVKWFICILILFMLIIFSCTRYDDVDKYIIYISKINQIIKENKHNTDLSGAAVLKYVTENKTMIETTLKNLNGYTINQTEANYNKLMKPVITLKTLLDRPLALYPDSISKEIMNVVLENQAIIDEQTEKLRQNSQNILKTAFTSVAATLMLVKQIIIEIPITNFNLSNNPDFIAAAQIMHLDNLVASN